MTWQDAYWASDQHTLDASRLDPQRFVMHTYGLCTRDDDGYIWVTHEAHQDTYTGTTVIPKGVVLGIDVYGSDVSNERGDRE